jgi:hypothetical protein
MKNKLYKCPECGLHYADKATAEQCQAWCSQYNSCNLDITKQSVEAQASKQQ